MIRRPVHFSIFLAMTCVWSSPWALAAPRAPTQLTVEDRVDPIGVGDPTPEFSWIPRDSEPNAAASAYRILVASTREKLQEGKADRGDSGRVKSSSVAFIPYAGKPLVSRDICYWKVRTADGKGQWGPWSQPARFEMGLLADEDWGVSWIWGKPKYGGHQYFYFRKPFSLPDKPIARARVYVSSVHHHLLYVDDQLFGKGQNHENPEYQYYQTFDIGPLLKPGHKQVVAARCHWFGGGQGRPTSRPGLLFKAVIDFTDGSSMTVGSDKTWKTRRAEWIVRGKPPHRNGEGIPTEYVDGRKHPVGWNLPDHDDSQWQPAVEIGPQPTEPWVNPLTAQETTIDEYEIAAISVKKLGESHFVADFGKVYSGRPRISFSGGKPGTLVRIKADYRQQPDGTLKGFAQSTKMDYQYILRGGQETFEPFWYLGFRYVQVEAGRVVELTDWPNVTGGPKAAERVDSLPVSFDGSTIRMVVRHNKVDPQRSSFECSDEMLNAVWQLVKRSAMLGSQECFVDTPTREQGQFVYDSYQMSLAAMKCFGERDLSQKALREFAHSQDKWHGDTGKVNAVYPYHGKRDIPDWTQSWVFWAYDYYMETGDLELIGDIFEQLVRTGEYNKHSENKTTGLIDWGNSPGYASGIVDWPNRYAYDRTTTQRTVLSCNAYLNYLYISRLAKALGRKDVAARFAKYAEDIQAAIQRQLWDDQKKAYVDGLYADGSKSKSTSQQANMLPLALGLTEGERTRGAMAAVKRAGHATAPMLIRFLMQAYGRHDEDESLMEFLLNPKGRNWAFIVADGGSFTYENWRGRLCNTMGEVSESHPVGAYGGVIALQQYILGVKPLAPRYARVRIRPHPGQLRFARGKIPTQRGPILVSWQAGPEAATFRITATIPCNVLADVYIPKGLSAGTTVKINGTMKDGQPAGNYILFKNIGAGEHVFVR